MKTSGKRRRGLLALIAAVAVVLTSLAGVSTPAQADTTLCSGSSFSSCINAGYTAHGYESHYTTSYWRATAGHNCTNYVGYMLTQNGDAGRGVLMNDGGGWDDVIRAHPEWGYTMNNSAAVGSIAQWDPYAGYTGASGHVAYVESVSANSITVSEDNYPSGPFRWRVISVGSPDWPTRFLHIKDLTASDTDGDGVPNSSDILPSVPGTTQNRGAPIQPSRLSGDFNGDGYQDIAAFYNYQEGGQTRLFLFKGQGNGTFASPTKVWDSNAGGWEWPRSKPVVGDFNGDGLDDIAVFYDYGNDLTRIWIFNGSSAATFPSPVVRWDSGVGKWRWSNTLPVAGDFNGDGYGDIAALYDYGNGLTRLFIFKGTGNSSIASPVKVWDSGVGGWEWQRSKPVTGDFNGDGLTDIAVLYGYDYDLTRLWVFNGLSNGTFASPVMRWDSGIGQWRWNYILPVAGDFNGDGYGDVAAFYDYGSDQTKLWVFNGSSAGTFTSPTVRWDSGIGQWRWSYILPVAGDFNGDGLADAAAFYNYSSDQTKLWVFNSLSNGAFASPVMRWDSGVNQWRWSRIGTP